MPNDIMWFLRHRCTSDTLTSKTLCSRLKFNRASLLSEILWITQTELQFIVGAIPASRAVEVLKSTTNQ